MEENTEDTFRKFYEPGEVGNPRSTEDLINQSEWNKKNRGKIPSREAGNAKYVSTVTVVDKTLQQQFCNADLAKFFFEKGISHPDPLFFWDPVFSHILVRPDNTQAYYPLYNSAEILIMLPFQAANDSYQKYGMFNAADPSANEKSFFCYMRSEVPGADFVGSYGPTEADARANLLAMLLNNGITTAKACNEQLAKYMDDANRRASHHV